MSNDDDDDDDDGDDGDDDDGDDDDGDDDDGDDDGISTLPPPTQWKEYPAIGSERSCQCARVMRLTSCSSVSSERDLVGIGLSGNPGKALRAH
ncbi:hypothetical protein ElyMa_003711000 [Elysia marginata]|uniref:Uncharacterized protein n=1 Tax=Elysia marginata TaxID=1093978 RepID=A0AAV4F2N9_9GAST|nr:hypothetical protein ElyMa_003711000 [Elysia marginata]